nr:transcription factor PCF1-like [Ipomoea batatas]
MVAANWSSSGRVKKSSDRHKKVFGRDRRIRLSLTCADRVFYLMKTLGHRTAGQTVEWLLSQAMPPINTVISGNVAQPLPIRAITPKEEPTMNPIQGLVKSESDFLCGIELEYSPMELAWIMFQSPVVNQLV